MACWRGRRFWHHCSKRGSHTLTSLQKHVDFGAWFAAIVAGYAIAKIVPVARNRIEMVLALPVVAAAIAAPVVAISSPQANTLYQGWSNSTQAVAAFKPWATNVNVLAEDYFIYSYYLGNAVKLQRWANTWHLDYVDRVPDARLLACRPIGMPSLTVISVPSPCLLAVPLNLITRSSPP